MAMVTKRRIIVERAAVLAITVLFLLPVCWLIATAYKPSNQIFSVPPTLFFEPTLDQFRKAFAAFDVVSLVRSSLIISIGTTVLSLLLGVPAGYALARAKSRYAAGFAYFFLAIRMIPAIAALIPFYLLMRDIGLLGSWWAVIVFNTMLNCAFVTWMMFSYFKSLPPDMEEAALTDGCTQMGAFLKVAVPATRSGMIACALFCMMFSWNDFLHPMFLTTLDSKPISVALLTAYGTKDITWGTLGALAHFSTIPIVLMALFMNRYFVQGATNGVQ
ncbi:carbohydrate ABC transporter permease [Rhizobium sp. S95]|uniref:Carbohydrate ABC transporter permease n=1 Tax=Ciceribacter sichuanensis TaxID=2949647 RepID=A0AAJ1BYN0_9HYPH|nr:MULTISPECIES: carbohydrate ABC transporter permease [unclassified Ciceribacter]MCM2394631.1 carbohydrate ABC transporter permease [Ciceribacter sp. S95]MCM2402725.1 carbohydrate ABC transporter permease [Ciceribacter sp. S153]MCO5958662.1 carbohydrate ABC transporter permease [Ciceribacter sp. S101]